MATPQTIFCFGDDLTTPIELGIAVRHNSAKVYAIKPAFGMAYIVLCHVGGHDPYATYVAVPASDGKFDLYSGHYHQYISDARYDFVERD